MFNMTKYPLSQKTWNSVRFARHIEHEMLDNSFAANLSFKDAGSRFSILKSVKTAPGPDECFSIYEVDARPIFKKLLGLELDYPGLFVSGQSQAAPYNTMNYYRSHIEEIFYLNGTKPLAPIEGECQMFYPMADVLIVQYEFRNTSATNVPLKLRWFSVPEKGLKRVVKSTAGGFKVGIEWKVHGNYLSTTRMTAFDGLEFKWTAGKFCSEWIDRDIPANKSLKMTFRFDFAINSWAKSGPIPTNPAQILKGSVERVERGYAHLASLSPPFDRFELFTLKAAGTLHTLHYLDRDRRGRPVPTIHASKAGVAATWFWDGAFTLLGLGLLRDESTAIGMTRLLLDGIKRDGTMPAMYRAGIYRYHQQQPILAWGMGQYLAQCPNRSFLAEVYPALGRYVHHWLKTCDADGNGLVEYPGRSICWDDALRWQNQFPIAFKKGENWTKQNWGQTDLGLFESVDTNTHLYLECRTMARMAARLGKKGDTRLWNSQADRLAACINELLYDPSTGTYQDRSIKDGRFTEMLTPASFMPIYAGIAPKEIARRAVKKYLLDPDRFYTPLPFPTLDRKHPAFRSGGFLYESPDYPGALCQQSYWIGRTWPHVSFWMVGALWQAGFQKEANNASLRILDAMNRCETINECYDSLTGYGNGHHEFMWSSAAVLALAYRLYSRGPVGEI